MASILLETDVRRRLCYIPFALPLTSVSGSTLTIYTSLWFMYIYQMNPFYSAMSTLGHH